MNETTRPDLRIPLSDGGCIHMSNARNDTPGCIEDNIVRLSAEGVLVWRVYRDKYIRNIQTDMKVVDVFVAVRIEGDRLAAMTVSGWLYKISMESGHATYAGWTK